MTISDSKFTILAVPGQ